MNGYDNPQARDADLLLYDTLGPLTREAVDASPGEIVIALMLTAAPKTLRKWSSDGWPVGWDDAGLARWLRGEIARRYPKTVANGIQAEGASRGPHGRASRIAERYIADPRHPDPPA